MLPTSASTSRSWTSSPNRARTRRPIESASIDVRGRSGSIAARALPRHESNPVVASGVETPGQPEQQAVGDPVQRRRTRPRRATGSGDTSSSARPTSRRQIHRVRHAGEERVGTAVDHVLDAGERRVPSIRPPTRSAASNTVTSSGRGAGELERRRRVRRSRRRRRRRAAVPVMRRHGAVATGRRPTLDHPIGERGHHRRDRR